MKLGQTSLRLLVCYSTLAHSQAPELKQLYMLITLPIWAAGINADLLITAIHQCGA